jgi:hypothetical protein
VVAIMGTPVLYTYPLAYNPFKAALVRSTEQLSPRLYASSNNPCSWLCISQQQQMQDVWCMHEARILHAVYLLSRGLIMVPALFHCLFSLLLLLLLTSMDAAFAMLACTHLHSTQQL